MSARVPAVRFLYAGAATLLAVTVALVAVGLAPRWTDDSVSLTGGSATEVVTLTVTGPRAGAVTAAIRVTPRRKTEGVPPPAVTLQAVLPTAGHTTPTVYARFLGSGRYSASVHLMTPGRWVLRVGVDDGRRGDRLDFPLAVSG
ncbi:hypothetical protein [Streptomyces sp. NPDC005435]|uniref:hypothetical protein n=1 Tax=Streptomyces sp. NPDC005435 TaxID=3154464 RepID=UPI00345490DE